MAEKNDVAETVRKGILVELTANIVSAYLGKNSVPGVEIPGLIRLETFRGGRRSSPEFIVCLKDGLKFKSLKRHLRSRYGISPELSDGRTELCGNPIAAGETNRTWTAKAAAESRA